MIPLLVFYVAVLGLAWWVSRWLARREVARRNRRAAELRTHRATLAMADRLAPIMAEQRRRIAARQINGPNLRPDVLRVPGETDEEIIGWLVDGHFERRREW